MDGLNGLWMNYFTLSSMTSNLFLFFQLDPYEQCEDLCLLNHELTVYPERET